MSARFRTRAIAAAVALASIAVALVASPASATLTVRQRIFGIENVDPVTGAVRDDRVILSWFGVTNFAAAIGGHVVLLDAWIPRGEYSGYVPVTLDELAAIEPSHIFLGHGHFDHAADAAALAVASGATIVGTAEHCAQAIRQAAPATISCTPLFAPGAPFGSAASPDVLPGVGITSIKHVHSAAEPVDPADEGGPHTPAAPPPDANAVVSHLPAPEDTIHLASHLGDAEGDSLLWRFEVGDFSLTWHDSSGPLKERAPHVLELLADRDVLGPTDVEVGAIMGFNQITNGLRDPRMYLEAIEPKLYVPSHHDNWAPGISTRGENYEPVFRQELQRTPEAKRPIVRWISDPQDYIRPEVLTFDIDAPIWD